jgi:hypothetical protein
LARRGRAPSWRFGFATRGTDKDGAGWWFGTFGYFFHILGMSSSQLIFIFFRGVETTNQNKDG